MLPSRNFLTLSYIPRGRMMRTSFSGSSEKKKNPRKFCSTSAYLLYEDTQLHRNQRSDYFPINPMKTTLIASLFSVTIALSSFGQPPPATTQPPKPPGTAPAPATSPATAPANTTTTTAPAPAISPATAMSPATTTTTTTAPGASATVPGVSPAPGMSPSTAAMSP